MKSEKPQISVCFHSSNFTQQLCNSPTPKKRAIGCSVSFIPMLLRADAQFPLKHLEPDEWAKQAHSFLLLVTPFLPRMASGGRRGMPLHPLLLEMKFWMKLCPQQEVLQISEPNLSTFLPSIFWKQSRTAEFFWFLVLENNEVVEPTVSNGGHKVASSQDIFSWHPHLEGCFLFLNQVFCFWCKLFW